MKIETQPREDHQVKLVVEYESEVLERFKHRAARKISKESKVPGFRPGKAPYEVVKRLFGEETITKQAVDLIIDDTYSDIIKQAEINPAGPGSLEKMESVDPLKLEIVVPLFPTVDLGDYRSIREEYNLEPVSPEDLDKFIERLRTNYASVEPVERPIAETDLVSILISGKLTSITDSEQAEVIKETPQQVIVQTEEQQKDTEWPFPGFSRQLIGLSVGEEKTFSFTHPDDSKDDRIKGKEVEYHVLVQTVKSMKLPELNDDFAQTVGEFETLEAMRKVVSDRMEEEAKQEYDNKFYNLVVEKIREQATIKYPPQVLEQEIQSSLERLNHDLSHQKLDLDTYLKLRKIEKDTFLEQEVKPKAIRQLESSLIIEELAKAEKIELNQERLEGEITSTVTEMQNSGQFQKMRKNTTPEKLVNAVAMDVATRMMNQQTLERLKEIATGQIEAEVVPAAQVEGIEEEFKVDPEEPATEAPEPVTPETATAEDNPSAE